MLKNALQKLVAALIPCSLLLTGCAAGGPPAAQRETPVFEKGTPVSPDAGIVSVENDTLSLSIDPADCSIQVLVKESGCIWASNPSRDYDDAYAKGIHKTNLFSQLVVTYLYNNATKTTNSQVSSVNRGTYTVSAIEQGFRVDYTFKEGFCIPVQYTIEGDRMEAAILFAEMTEPEDCQIQQLEVLPYFGTASEQDEGYMLIPDGCGALVYLNNGKTACGSYDKEIFGPDEALPNSYETSRSEQIYMPVFGMKKNADAYVAVVTQGAGLARILSSVAGSSTGLNTLYTVAEYRVLERLNVLNGSLGTAGAVLYAAQEPTDIPAYCVEYAFLSREAADYNGMAARCREWFAGEGWLPDAGEAAALYVDLYGGVSKLKYWLGVPYTGVEPLTTFAQAQERLAGIQEAGAGELAVHYRSMSAAFFDGKLPVDLKPASVLGGVKGLRDLLDFAGQQKIDFYAGADFYSFRESGNGISKYLDICKELDLGAATVTPKGLNTNYADTSQASYYLLKPSRFGEAAQLLQATAAKYGITGLALEDTAHRLAGDYALGGRQRESAIESVVQATAQLEGQRLLLAAPNSYLWAAADRITDLPLASSGNLLFDEDIPFLQMLLKGRVSYAGPAVNIAGVSDDLFLDSVSYMALPHYAFIADSASDLQNTAMLQLYGLSSAQTGRAVREYQAMAPIYNLVSGAAIRTYARHDQLAETVYDNGCCVYVNYGGEEAVTNGITVPARGYAVVKDGRTVLTGTEVVM